MKKLLKILVTTFLFALIFAVCCFAEGKVVASGEAGQNVTWELHSVGETVSIEYHLYFKGSGSILGVNKDGGGTNYNNHDNSQFADHWDYITKVYIDEGITGIDKFGLAFFPELQSVEFPSTLKSLGTAAFENCPKLRTVYPKGTQNPSGTDLTGITSIGAYAFDGCSSISSLKLDPNFSGKIEAQTFKGLAMLVTIVFPEGVTSIGEQAFENCAALTAIQIKGNPKISKSAFNGCAKLKTVYGVAGTSGETLCGQIGARFSTKEMEEIVVEPGLIAGGDCGENVYWKIKNAGTDDEPYYVFEVYGEGDTMENYNSSGEGIVWANQDEMQWAEYVPYIKKVIIGDNITRLYNCAVAYLDFVEYIELSPNVTHLGDKVFEGDNALKSIYIRGNEPVEGHADMSNIVDHGPYQFDGCSRLYKFTFNENMDYQILDIEFFKGTSVINITIPEQFTRIHKNAFKDCSGLTTIRFLGDPEIDEGTFNGNFALKTIYGQKGGRVEAYAKAHGIDFFSAVDVLVYLDGELLARDSVIPGSVYNNICFDGNLYMLYTDRYATKPYDLSSVVSKKLVLHAVPLLESADFDVRSSEYNGLRGLFDFDLTSADGNSLYSIAELGAIASLKRGVDMEYMELYKTGVFRSTVVQSDAVIGSLAEVPLGRTARFAFTAAGYEGDAFDGRAAENIYMRGYVILQNRETGERYTYYTAVKSSSLAEASRTALAAGAFDDAGNEFISAASSVTVLERTIYNKFELMDALKSIYSDADKYIVGQYITYGNEKSLAEFSDSFFEMTGENIAMISLDMSTMEQSGNITDEQLDTLVADIVEYARMGGVFTLSYHSVNPIDGTVGGRGEIGTEDSVWEELVTPGTAANSALNAFLDIAANFLQKLEDAGVPILWRPLHEMNGDWFWWCVRQGDNSETVAAENYIRLWQYYYDYFENQKGLDNLIWVFSPNFETNVTETVMYPYPGDEYVDIVGCDWYTSTATVSNLQGANESYSALMATGKPVALTEYGTRGSLDSMWEKKQQQIYSCLDQRETCLEMIEAGLPLIYVLNWNGGYEYSRLGYADEYMAAPETLGCTEFLEIIRSVSN